MLTGQYKKGYSDYLDREGVYPCSSYGQAVEKLQSLIDEKIGGGMLNDDIVKTAKEFGLTLPDDYEHKLRERNLCQIEKQIVEAEKTLADLREKAKALINRIIF